MSAPSSTSREHVEHHIMLDLETLGVTPGSVVCSLAAVHFDLETGNVYSTFHQRISIQSCLDAGLTINGETLEWWMQQSDQARQEVCGKNTVPLKNALDGFSRFLHGIDRNTKSFRIWGNSSDFDCSILAAAYQAVKIGVPWPFWGTRCVRTITSIYPDIKKAFKFEGVQHNPLDDSKNQVKYLCATMAYIKHGLSTISPAKSPGS